MALREIDRLSQPSALSNPQHCKQQCKAIQCLRTLTYPRDRPSTQFFWRNSLVDEWACGRESSLTIVSGNAATKDYAEQIALEAVEYIEEHQQDAIWVLNPPRDENYEYLIGRLTAMDILQHIAITLLKQKLLESAEKSVSHLISQLQSATEAAWINVCASLLKQTRKHIVIDLGVFDGRSDEVDSLVAAFKSLLKAMKCGSSEFGTVGILMITCWPISTDQERLIQIPQQGNIMLHTSGFLSGLQSDHLYRPRYVGGKPAVGDADLQPKQASIQRINTGSVAAKQRKKKQKQNDWFSGFNAFETCIDASRKDPDENLARVKIGILDTGCDLTHPDLMKAKENGRLKHYDFIENSENISDADGHGTHCTSLLVKFAPNAEIYVGRVFQNSHSDEDSVGILTRAIKYACDSWEVDIISLSLGFTESDYSLSYEIGMARAKRTLIFAAAANNTTNERLPIRYPARSQEAFCIFSCDAYGHPSPFNPFPQQGMYNFVVPGEEIQGAWPESLRDETTFQRMNPEQRIATYKKLNGTSPATAIAASVAAGVLEFAWQKRGYEIRNVELLKHINGMSDIFVKKMVDEHRVGEARYLYIKPWLLISDEVKKEEIPVLISNVMDYVKV